MISFACPACQKNLTVKDEFAGKRGTCPHCKQVLVVLAPAPAAASAPGAPVQEPLTNFHRLMFDVKDV